MAQQIALPDSARAPETDRDDKVRLVALDLAYRRCILANVVFYGEPDSNHWVLVDAGVQGTYGQISSAAEALYGDVPPRAIVLTHGHFDHIGALGELAEKWGVPIYAHSAERPYLDGSKAYPPPDTAAGGGLVPAFSSHFPRGPIDVSGWLRDLPEDGLVPEMPGWRWIATPGHAPGHVSLFRESDRALIAGDAVVTTAQESLYAVAAQPLEMHGPPKYFTPDWFSASRSVARLADLSPELLITGHGRAATGPSMRNGLRELAAHFAEVAVPAHRKPEVVY